MDESFIFDRMKRWLVLKTHCIRLLPLRHWEASHTRKKGEGLKQYLLPYWMPMESQYQNNTLFRIWVGRTWFWSRYITKNGACRFNFVEHSNYSWKVPSQYKEVKEWLLHRKESPGIFVCGREGAHIWFINWMRCVEEILWLPLCKA